MSQNASLIDRHQGDHQISITSQHVDQLGFLILPEGINYGFSNCGSVSRIFFANDHAREMQQGIVSDQPAFHG